MNYIILDDEPLARQALAMELASINGLVHLGSFARAVDALSVCASGAVDLLFLDIEMPGCSGFDFLDALAHPPIVIFTTAFAQYAADSYSYHAVDYLLKPLKSARVLQAVQKAIHYHTLLRTAAGDAGVPQLTPEYIVIRSDRKYRRIMLSDILFIEGLKDYALIHTGTQQLLASMNIKTISNGLPPAQFCRVSKSYLVNIRHIDSMDNELVYLGTHEIPLSTSYREELMEKWLSGRLVKR